MRTAIIRLFVLALLIAVPGAAQALPKIEIFTTPAGITVWHVVTPEVPVVAIRAAWRGGGGADPIDRAGLARMATALLTEGAGDLDSEGFQGRVYDRSLSLFFNAGEDWIVGTGNGLSRDVDLLADLLAAAVTAPRFDDEPLERVRRQMIAAAERAEEEPASIARRTWFAQAFPEHPYGRPAGGSPDSLKRITADDLRAFVKARLARDNLLVAVAGDFDAARLAGLVDRAFAGLPARAVPVNLPTIAPRRHSAVTIIARPGSQTMFYFGGPGVARGDPDWYAATLANYLVGGSGASARLTIALREQRGLTYGIHTGLATAEASPLMTGAFATRNDQAGTALSVLKSTLAQVRIDGLDADDLARAKAALIASYPLGLTSNAALADALLALQRNNLPPDQFARYPDLVGAVTLDDLRRVTRRLFNPADLMVVAVGEPVGIVP